MPKNEVKQEIFEDLQNNEIIFRNFAGKVDQYNAQGKREFSIVLPQERADDLSAKGWNVKMLKSRDDDEPPVPFLKVEANIDGAYPPKIYLMSGSYAQNGAIDIQSKTLLTAETVGELDHANFAKVDLIISPYVWEWNGRTGVKAYLKALYATVILDELALKYANINEATNLAPNIYEDDEVPFN